MERVTYVILATRPYKLMGKSGKKKVKNMSIIEITHIHLKLCIRNVFFLVFKMF